MALGKREAAVVGGKLESRPECGESDRRAQPVRGGGHDGKMASVSGHSSSNATINGNGNSPASPENKQNGSSLPLIYQALAMCLKDPDKKYQDKVSAVLSAWERLASFSATSLTDDIHSITEYLYRETLLLVLRGEWNKLPAINKTHLCVTLKRTRDMMSDKGTRDLCDKVKKLVENPWADETLTKILNADPDLTESEAMDFCIMETPTLLSMRLDLLCDDKCKDLALRLVGWCRKCLASPSDTRFSDICTPSQRQHWTDLHIALLYRAKQDEMVHQLKQLSLEEGYHLVQRFVSRATPPSDAGTQPVSVCAGNSSGRVWRNSLKIAELASQIFMTTGLNRCPPPTCLSVLTTQLIQLERQLGTSKQKLTEMIRKLVHHGDMVTSAHMYILCGALSKESISGQEEDLKPLAIELLVQAVAVDVNDLEKRKHRGDGQVTDEVRQAELSLSTKISTLAELVKTQPGIRRECVLTAFSLHPTQQLFDQLEQLAAASDQRSMKEQRPPTIPGADYDGARSSASSATHYNPSVIEHNRAAVVGEPPPGSGGGPGGTEEFDLPFTAISSNGDVKTEALASEDADSGVDLSDGTVAGEQESTPRSSSPPSNSTSPFSLTSPYCAGAAEDLGVSKQIIDDLAVVLHSCRWEVLSWNLPGGWNELRSLCLQYLHDQAEMRCVTKELKYLPTTIDYRQFDHIPRVERDENFGIEKGYELRTSDDEDADVGRAQVRRRRKSSLSTDKRSSYPASGESSDAEPKQAATGDAALDVEHKKKVLKKKVYKRIKALKTSSDSDSQCSLGQLPHSPSSVAATKVKNCAKGPRNVRNPSRIKSSCLDSIQSVEPTVSTRAAKSSRLVKTLRMLRPEFASGNSWCDPNHPQPPTSRASSCCSSSQLQPVTSNGHSNNHQSSASKDEPRSPPTPTDHFAPMLSTLNMNPKIILTRTPVKNDPTPTKKANPVPTPTGLTETLSSRCSGQKILTYNIGTGGPVGAPRPYVLLERLNKSTFQGLESTMASLKSIDMFQVRPPPTAVHMVQLPNPPTANNHMGNSNGILSSSTGGSVGVGVGSNGGPNPGQQPSQQTLSQQPQDDSNKSGSSTASGTDDSQPFVGTGSNNNTEIIATPATAATATSTTTMTTASTFSSSSEDSHPISSVAGTPNDSVTLVSTPSVSIFQVAHRPTHNATVTLQPVAAVTGFNHPPPVALPTPMARVKTPAHGSAGRGRHRGQGRAAQAASATTPTTEISLSQLLAQSSPSSNADPTDNSGGQQTFNGPVAAARRQEPGRVVRAARRDSQTDSSGVPSVVALVGGSGSSDSSPCRVPLVKYVDLDAVSSPTRPRPTGSIGMRRQSQGSNSNSPDPHQQQGRSSVNKNRSSSAAGVNPASPAINSPQSPALQAPPSPLSYRKQQQQPQHYSNVYRQQDGKIGTDKTAADRLSSPSHPSQCSSPFSRPSSRSQDASPSPSELLGSMYPPSTFLPYTSADPAGAILSNPATATPASATRSNFGAASPSQSPSAGCLPALPKFQQAFGKKSLTTHFDILPAGMMGSTSPLAGISQLDATGTSRGPMASSSSLGGNGYATDNRRFVPAGEPQPPNPPAEDEGLGSKLQSLLESALNGQISRSPTRHLQPPVPHQSSSLHQSMVVPPDLMLTGSGSMDSQVDADSMMGAGGSYLLSEQLREFESVFERVASTSHLKDSQLPPISAWASDLAVHDPGNDPDDLGSGTYSIGPVADYLAPSSNYSGSMDVSAASPVSIGAASGLTAPGSAGGATACCSPHSTTDDPISKHTDSTVSQSAESEAPLMQLLTVASAARQALADEEKCTNSNSSHSSSSSSSTASLNPVVDNPEPVKQESLERRPANRPVETETARVLTSVIVANIENKTGRATAAAAAAPTDKPSTAKPDPGITSTSATATTTTTTSAATPAATPAKSEPAKPIRKQVSSKNSPAVSPGVASGGSSPSKTASSTPNAASSSVAAVSPASGSGGAAKPPQKAHDDEITVLRVNAILEEYREQLRNSPDLQNKPAPRRRSNPLPSPSTATPKRRKSVQSKVKLLSHAVRPADASATTSDTPIATVGSGESAAETAGDTSGENPTKTSESAAETPTTATPTTTSAPTVTPGTTPSVQVINNSTGVPITIPVSAVTAVTDATGNRIIHPSFIHATTCDGNTFVTATPTVSISTNAASAPHAVPITMQQLLVTSQSGVRQVLLPISNVAGLRQALVANSRGVTTATTRFISLRTVGGQTGFIGLPARLSAPITVRTVASNAPQTQEGAATTGTQESRVLIQELLTTGQTQRTVSGTAGAVHWAPTVPSVSPASSTSEPESGGDPPKVETTGSVLRFVPTVNRVSLPVAPGVDAATLIAAANQTSTPVLVPSSGPDPTNTTPVTTEANSVGSWTGQNAVASDSPRPSSSVDDALTPVPLGAAPDEKLLNDTETGVSEFLPCADFMGPGVSPSPCFSFSDSPLGSQNSLSPAASPATFQASSAEEDSNAASVPEGADLQSPKAKRANQQLKSKILKRSEKPRVVMVRNDHGGMEYRRVSDASVEGPAVIRSSHRKNFSRKQSMSRQVTAAAHAAAVNQKMTAHLQTPSPTPPTDSESANAVKEEAASLDGSPRANDETPQPESQSSMDLPDGERVAGVTETGTIRAQSEIKTESVVDGSPSATPEVSSPPVIAPDSIAAPESKDQEANTCQQRRQPRRCMRLQKDPQSIPKTECDSNLQDRESPQKTKRRSSTRGHFKKNCPCCGNGGSDRKRTKSEASAGAGECPSSGEVTCSPAKKLSTGSPESDSSAPGALLKSETALGATGAAPVQSTQNKSAKAKKNAQRKR